MLFWEMDVHYACYLHIIVNMVTVYFSFFCCCCFHLLSMYSGHSHKCVHWHDWQWRLLFFSFTQQFKDTCFSFDVTVPSTVQAKIFQVFSWLLMQQNISKPRDSVYHACLLWQQDSLLPDNCSYLCVKPPEHMAVSVCVLALCHVTDSHRRSVTAGIVVTPEGHESQHWLCEGRVTRHTALWIFHYPKNNASCSI